MKQIKDKAGKVVLVPERWWTWPHDCISARVPWWTVLWRLLWMPVGLLGCVLIATYALATYGRWKWPCL